MNTIEFTFPSKDGITKIHAVKWVPESGEYKAILQITHGMIEFIERYIPFAEYLTNQGYMVVGHDHIGHGDSINSKDDWGYFADKNSGEILIQDMHTLRTMIQKENPNVPYFMMGHSMGSYMLRRYLAKYQNNLTGVIIMGTGYVSPVTAKMGNLMAKTVGVFRGHRYRSSFLENASFSAPYKKYDVTGKNQENSWLTKDVEIVKRYYSEPKCTFKFTANGYQTLTETVAIDCKQQTIDSYPKNLPVFIVSGAQDPVGNLGTGVKKVYEMFQKAGIKDVSCKLYENDRHEILNELDRETVYQDIFQWLEQRRTK